MTLDDDTLTQLDRYARKAGKQRATVARTLLCAALAQLEERERLRKLAGDYAKGRADATKLLAELEGAQLDLLGDEDA